MEGFASALSRDLAVFVLVIAHSDGRDGHFMLLQRSIHRPNVVLQRTDEKQKKKESNSKRKLLGVSERTIDLSQARGTSTRQTAANENGGLRKRGLERKVSAKVLWQLPGKKESSFLRGRSQNWVSLLHGCLTHKCPRPLTAPALRLPQRWRALYEVLDALWLSGCGQLAGGRNSLNVQVAISACKHGR